MINWLFRLFKKKVNQDLSEFNELRKERIYSKIEELVGKEPKLKHYYIKAFTHRSYLEISKEKIKSNERLEFLGDSILGKISAEYLFQQYPYENEGFLTKSRAHLVNKHSLERIAYELNLQELVFINEKYLSNEKKKLSNIVADLLEALIAAIYLDMGESVVNKFVLEYVIKPQVLNGDLNYDTNYKGRLLEYAHANKINQPVYTVLKQIGPQHDKIYTIQVYINEEIQGLAEGPNKKTAEQKAAKKALDLLENINN